MFEYNFVFYYRQLSCYRTKKNYYIGSLNHITDEEYLNWIGRCQLVTLTVKITFLQCECDKNVFDISVNCVMKNYVVFL